MEREHWLRSRMKFSAMDDVPALAQESATRGLASTLCVVHCRMPTERASAEACTLWRRHVADGAVSPSVQTSQKGPPQKQPGVERREERTSRNPGMRNP